jgi:ABC-type glycerol-3-phosphate transport system permease component
MAGVVIMSLPVIGTFFAEGFLVEGLTAGSVKGQASASSCVIAG